MVRRYCVIAFVLLCVCLAVQPMSIAYATEGSEGGDFSYKVVYGPSTPTILGSTKQVQVYAPNNYEAALIVLGYQNDSRLTSDERALLSNQSTGGTFYDFAQGFSNNNDYWGNQLNFQDLGMNSALTMNNSMYGANNIWSSEYDDTMYDGAKQRVEAVLNGDISDGGSSGGNSSTYTLGLSSNPQPERAYIAGLNTSGSDIVRCNVMPSTSTITVNDTIQQQIDNYRGNGYDLIIIMNGHWSSNTLKNTVIFYLMKSGDYTIDSVSDNGVTYPHIFKSANLTYYSLQGNFTSGEYTGGELSFEFNPDSSRSRFINWTNQIDQYIGGEISSTIHNNYGGYYLVLTSNGGSTPQEPTIPPTNWPENPTPTTPQPPEVPSPPNDPVTPQPPEPTDPTNPVYPTPVYEPDFVWQTADLSAILSAMDAHCRHLQAALHRECSNLWANLSVKIGTEFKTLRSFLHGQFDWLVDSIDEEFDDFELYIKTLFEWLADQMEFSFTGGGYDDNTVVSWLKKIYSKLGGGTNTRPVDPTVEPDNWWDWLTRLIADWIAGLTDMGLDELAGLLDMLQELITKFPFSIPWDIAALLSLLVSEPVTPEIRFPQMALTGSGLTQVGEYVVNLSDYNAVWDGVRFIEKVGFCIFLAWNTVHFMDLFKKGANSE